MNRLPLALAKSSKVALLGVSRYEQNGLTDNVLNTFLRFELTPSYRFWDYFLELLSRVMRFLNEAGFYVFVEFGPSDGGSAK